MQFLKTAFSSFVVFGTLLCVLVSCGGGGGGGNDSGSAQDLVPAYVVMDAEPRTIDSGDRMRVTVRFTDVQETGAILKVRFPTALEYVSESSFLTIAGDTVNIGPSATATSGNFGFVVYEFPEDLFVEEDGGSVTLVLQGTGALDSGGKIGVDADFNDPGKSISEEFSKANPLFDAEDELEVRVKDANSSSSSSSSSSGSSSSSSSS